jgi:hypothetical protein
LVQACLNQVVDDKIQGRPIAIPAQAPRQFVSCQQASSQSAMQECYDNWVIQRQLAAAPPGTVGAGCGVVSPDSKRDCVNYWARGNLPRASSCEGSPEDTQKCINSIVESSMQCPAPAS